MSTETDYKNTPEVHDTQVAGTYLQKFDLSFFSIPTTAKWYVIL